MTLIKKLGNHANWAYSRTLSRGSSHFRCDVAKCTRSMMAQSSGVPAEIERTTTMNVGSKKDTEFFPQERKKKRGGDHENVILKWSFKVFQ